MKAKAIALMLATLLESASLLAQQDPFIGTWKLNLAKSKYSPGPALKSETVMLEPYGKSGQKLIADGVNAQGAPTHMDWSAEFDGKDYPVKGSQISDTLSLKRIGPNIEEATFKKGGKATVTLRAVVSKDGKTTTTTSTGTDAQGQRVDNVAVYDRQ